MSIQSWAHLHIYTQPVQSTLFRLQCGTEAWGPSSSSCSLHQTLHSGPRWNGFSSHQPSLWSHRASVSCFNWRWRIGIVLHVTCIAQCITIYCTFPYEGRNSEIHPLKCWMVNHFVLFHIIKLHSACKSINLLCWSIQTKKAAEFVYFPSSILETQRSDTVTTLLPARAEL